MPNTKYIMAEEVISLVKGANPSAASNLITSTVIKMLENLINQHLKADHVSTQLATGETIPDGIILATYEAIPVSKYKRDFSRAKLPCSPISLPRGMGIFFIGQHIPNNMLEDINLTATAISISQINLSWTLVEHATMYLLERSTSSDFSQNLIQLYSGTNLSFNDLGLDKATTYYYRIVATAPLYNDSLFDTASATTLNVLILATPELKCDDANVTTSSILCTWLTVPNASLYILEKSSTPEFNTGVQIIYAGPLLQFNDTGLNSGTTYYYRLKCVASNYADSLYSTNSNTTLVKIKIFDKTFDKTFN